MDTNRRGWGSRDFSSIPDVGLSSRMRGLESKVKPQASSFESDVSSSRAIRFRTVNILFPVRRLQEGSLEGSTWERSRAPRFSNGRPVGLSHLTLVFAPSQVLGPSLVDKR